MKIHLKASKTDPCRKGVDIFVGRTWDRLCPISAMMAYLAVRGNAGGFLFKFKDGKLLAKSRFIARVRGAHMQAGIPHKGYTGHSFRIGAATTAHARGLGDATIKKLGRWESAAYLLYVRTPREKLVTFTAKLSNS